MNSFLLTHGSHSGRLGIEDSLCLGVRVGVGVDELVIDVEYIVGVHKVYTQFHPLRVCI